MYYREHVSLGITLVCCVRIPKYLYHVLYLIRACTLNESNTLYSVQIIYCIGSHIKMSKRQETSSTQQFVAIHIVDALL